MTPADLERLMRSSSAPGARRAPAAKGGESPSDMDRKFCPVCKAKRDVNKEKTVMTCCSRTVCAKCAERLHEKRAACPLCDVAFPRDDDETLARLVRAADAGDARAQFALGDLYDNGEGVPHDPKRALRYYTLAADQGHTSAEFNVGSIHENGDGVSRDVAAARRWFERAAAKGHDKAAALLSFLEQQGD